MKSLMSGAACQPLLVDMTVHAATLMQAPFAYLRVWIKESAL